MAYSGGLQFARSELKASTRTAFPQLLGRWHPGAVEGDARVLAQSQRADGAVGDASCVDDRHFGLALQAVVHEANQPAVVLLTRASCRSGARYED